MERTKKMMSWVLTFSLVLSLFAGIGINEPANAVTSSEVLHISDADMQQQLLQAYYSVQPYITYNLNYAANPYQDFAALYATNPSACKLNCAGFVSYVYSYYFREILGYGYDGLNNDVFPTKAQLRNNPNWVDNWVAFESARGNYTDCTLDSLLAGGASGTVPAGTILYYKKGGAYYHIGIYVGAIDNTGTQYMIHCTSNKDANGNMKNVILEPVTNVAKKGASAISLVGMTETIEHQGSVKVYKTDKAGNALKGAGFTLYNSQTGNVATNNRGETMAGYTGSDGYLSFEHLPLQLYVLQETYIPEGYNNTDQTAGSGYYADLSDYTKETGYAINQSFAGKSGWVLWLNQTNETQPYVIHAFNDGGKTIAKVWDDNNNKAGLRPKSVKIKVRDTTAAKDLAEIELGYADDAKTTILDGTSISGDGNTWSYDLTKISGYNPTHDYSLTETTTLPEGYTFSVQGLTIVNAYAKHVVKPTDTQPGWTWPTYNVTGEKDDSEGGFDNSVHTARGNATLAATFDVYVDGNQYGSMTANDNGYGAEVNSIPIWSSVGEAVNSDDPTYTSTSEGDYMDSIGYYYTATMKVVEERPEGYLSESNSGTGDGTRTYTLGFHAFAQRTVSESTDDDGNTTITLGPWQYTYTTTSSDTGTNVSNGSAPSNLNVANPVFVNRVMKGNAQLVKTYDDDLNPWTTIVGEKQQMPGCWWSLQLVNGSEESNTMTHGGSESHNYVVVKKINDGEAGYTAYGNSYRVCTTSEGSTAGAFVANGTSEGNSLITGGSTDSSGNQKGQIYIYDLPYGEYKMSEIRCDANIGYVLETYYFYVNKTNDEATDKKDSTSQEVSDKVISNVVVVTKKDSETGKTVPIANAAFRIKYLGYKLNGVLVTDDTADKRLSDGTQLKVGSYITNGSSVQDGYQYVFYTDATGRFKVPYEMEYGVWQLEEITAPQGYYIGQYGTDGVAHSVNGTTLNGNEANADDTTNKDGTVAIFDASGNKVNYTTDSTIIYNYYQFEVSDQTKTDPDGDGKYTLNIVINDVSASDDRVMGKIEVKKVAEKLVGFTDSQSTYGTVSTPVYEMVPLEGATFDVVAATDETYSDGYGAPELLDTNGSIVTPELITYTQKLWTAAESVQYAELSDGTEAYITTTRYDRDDTNASGTTPDSPNWNPSSTQNLISANLLTALKKGVDYKLSYIVENTDDKSGIKATTQYDIDISMEYAAGGWNYSYADVTRSTTMSDYVSSIKSDLPVITHNGADTKVADLTLGTTTLGDGSSIDLNAKTDTYINQNNENNEPTINTDTSVTPVRVTYYDDVVPVAYDYATAGNEVTVTVPDGYDKSTNVDTNGGICYANAATGKYCHIVNDNGVQKTLETDSVEQKPVYSNEPPDVADYEAKGYTFEAKEISCKEADNDATYTGTLFTLTKDKTTLYYLSNPISKSKEWVNSTYIVRANDSQWRTDYSSVALPDGFAAVGHQNENGDFLAYSDNEGVYAVLVKTDKDGTLKWVRVDDADNTYISRVESASFDLNESNESTDGFTITWGDFVFTNKAEHDKDDAIATIYNPSQETPTIRDGIGCEKSTSEDGKTLTIKVVQPTTQAWYQLVDGVKAGITYLGGYTKTTIKVPEYDFLPSITYKGTAVSYYDTEKMNPSKSNTSVVTMTTASGDGNYITIEYDQSTGTYTLYIVSNQTTKADGYVVNYHTGQTGYSIVLTDTDHNNAQRGQLSIQSIAKTLKYKSGTIIERLTTNAAGTAYSSLLPLGTYYVREVDSGLGYTISKDSYEVNLAYKGQYVPIVWGSAGIQNDALNVNIDIAKGFQKAVGSDEYEYKAGAVFGVYNSDTITAGNTPTDASTISKNSIAANSLLSVVTIGDNGYAATTLKLPYNNQYYIKELDTLDGFTLSDVKYLFRVDEESTADNLTFSFDNTNATNTDGRNTDADKDKQNTDSEGSRDGISGEINQTDLYQTTIAIDTLYQVPARTMDINGQAVSSDTALNKTIAGAATITNEVLSDRTRTTIVATDSAPTVIKFDNGSVLTVTVYSDGYTAYFTKPTEDGCTLTTDKGDVNTTTITEVDDTNAGTKQFTYNPAVAYTGYTVDVTDAYRAPTTVLNTKDGLRINLSFDKASGHRKAIITYPAGIQLPVPTSTETWLTADSNAHTITVDMDELLANGKNTLEYKVILDYMNDAIEATNFSYVVSSNTALTEDDIISKSKAKATTNHGEMTLSVDKTALDKVNADIAKLAKATSKTVLEEDVPIVGTDSQKNKVTATINIELKSSSDINDVVEQKTIAASASFPLTYGQSINFTQSADSFSINSVGATCSSSDGLQNDNITVAHGNNDVTISHQDKSFAATAENGTSSMKADLTHDSSDASIYLTKGTPASAHDGTDEVTFINGYVLMPGHVLTVVAQDGVMYVASLDKNGVFKLHNEAVINGAIATGDNAPSAILSDGQTYYSDTEIASGANAKFGTTTTYKRSSTSVSQITVKVNSTSNNFITSDEAAGTASGNPTTVKNDIITVDFEKKSLEGAPLAGSVIAAYDATGAEVFKGTTNANGIAEWVKAQPGTYTFREITAPEGYKLDGSVYTLTIYADGTISGNRTLYDEKLLPKTQATGSVAATVTISKTDVTNSKPVAGATIVVWNQATGQQVYSGKTDANGKISFTKPTAGTYVFKEIAAPAGYALNTAEFTFVVGSDGSITGTLGIKDQKSTSVVISKTDVTDATPIPGAQITIWNAAGSVVFTGYTGKDGNITFKKAVPGTYTFKETVAPNGYLINTTTFTFTVNQDGTVTGTTGIKDAKATEVLLNKYDATDGSGVKDAEITIWNAAGQVAFVGKTNDKGQLAFANATVGTYTYKETVAPAGYDLNEKTYAFSVNQDGTVTGTTGFKDIRTGTVIITKTDVIDGQSIPGAEITVTDKSGNIVFKQVTDEEGKIYFFPPKAGSYTFYESYSPDGYYLNEDHCTFTVDKDGNVTSGTTNLTNVPFGTVVITKTDAETGAPLPGAVITIWDAEGNPVFQGTTDERGRIYFVSPGAGTYTFEESLAPDGYTRNENTFQFNIDESYVITGTTSITDDKGGTPSIPGVPKTGMTDWTSIILITILSLLGICIISGSYILFQKKKSKKANRH